jgi:hypothetical protein
VSRFLQNAARILEAAESVSGSHESIFPEMTISIGPEGGIRMVAQGTGLPLDVLQDQLGAQMIYRVTQQESSVRLEGRAGSRTCLFEAEKPDGAARILLGDGPRYAAASFPLALAAALPPPPPRWQSEDSFPEARIHYF